MRLSLPEAPVGDVLTLAECSARAVRGTVMRELPRSSPTWMRLRPPHPHVSDIFVGWAVSTAALAGSAIAFVLFLLLGAA